MNSVPYRQTVAAFNNTTLNLDKIDCTNHSTFAAMAVLTGASIAGTFKLQYSDNGSDWLDVTGATVAIAGPGAYGVETETKHMHYRPVLISSNTNNMAGNVSGVAKAW